MIVMGTMTFCMLSATVTLLGQIATIRLKGCQSLSQTNCKKDRQWCLGYRVGMLNSC